MEIQNTKRLSFQLMTEKDEDLLFQLDQDPAVMKYISGGELSSREKIKNVFIPRMNAYRESEKGWGLWQTNILETGEFIGWILIRPMHFFSDAPEMHNLEIGWRFKQKSWGQGFATEAAKQVMSAIKNIHTDIESFSAIADEENNASIGVMKNLGMQYIKTYHHKDQLIDCQVAYYQVNSKYC